MGRIYILGSKFIQGIRGGLRDTFPDPVEQFNLSSRAAEPLSVVRIRIRLRAGGLNAEPDPEPEPELEQDTDTGPEPVGPNLGNNDRLIIGSGIGSTI